MAYIREFLAGSNLPQFSLPGIGFKDFIDIFLIACLLYLFLRWIRQMRAWSLFKGIAVILAIAAAAYLFDLVTVRWVVQNTFAMGLIAVVILFQPEFRRALEQIGRGRLFANFSMREHSGGNAVVSAGTAAEVVKAAKIMAAARTGALIVLEQAVALGDHERAGIPVDAVVSCELLVNIFEKNTPLHDGAVIIRHNRVTAATCILPLTSDELEHDLGTRHRAAVGISEVSDAIAVTVSEETGAISVAIGGELTRGLNEYQLRDILMKNSGGQKARFVLFKQRKEKT